MNADSLLRFYFSFHGRASRSDVWLRHALPAVLLYAILLPLTLATADMTFVIAVATVATIVVTWSGLAVSARRCHDRDRSAWFILAGLVPIVSCWYLVELCLLRGTEGPNRFGADPLGRETAHEEPEAHLLRA